MTPETRMAFGFIAETIRRDTVRWREKHQRYQTAARRRWEQSGERKEPERPRSSHHGQWEPSDVEEIWKRYIDCDRQAADRPCSGE